MYSLNILRVLVIAMSVVCHTLPQNDIAKNIAAKHGLQEEKSEDHRITGPQYGCKIRYETKFEIQEIESVRQECNHYTETKCTTHTRPKCEHHHEKKCDTKYKEECRHYKEQECTDTWRSQCVTRSKEVCDFVVKEIQVPYVEDECITRQERRCEKHWEESIEGGIVKKVWVDNLPTCKLYDATDCKPVTKHRQELTKERKCNQVPYQHCDRVKDTQCHLVPRKECKDIPYQDCRDVVIEVCNPESYQDCQDYPRRKCRDVHEKKPQQVTVQVPIRDCSFSSDNHHHIPRANKLDEQLDAQVIENSDKILFKIGENEVNKEEVDGNDDDNHKDDDVKFKKENL
jgi:hypothetical protein